LGLSISYGIIKDYNGSIQVKSDVGHGTRFKISFPAHVKEEYGAKTKTQDIDHR
jgi:signal transduction histidine kinase